MRSLEVTRAISRPLLQITAAPPQCSCDFNTSSDLPGFLPQFLRRKRPAFFYNNGSSKDFIENGEKVCIISTSVQMVIVVILVVVENHRFDKSKIVESDPNISPTVIHREYEKRSKYLKYDHRNDVNTRNYECW